MSIIGDDSIETLKVRSSDPSGATGPGDLPNSTIEHQASELQRLGEAVHRSNNRSRVAIYEALAAVARFSVANSTRTADVRAYLQHMGVRPAREGAPIHLRLLPLLKLVLGVRDGSRGRQKNDGDNATRRSLQRQASDYSMALAYAIEQNVDASEIVEFFNRPGNGIVEAAQRYRRATTRPKRASSQTDIWGRLENLSPMAMISLTDLPNAGCDPLVLIVKPDGDMWAVQATIDDPKAIRDLVSYLPAGRK
jgi:hypothetical protein